MSAKQEAVQDKSSILTYIDSASGEEALSLSLSLSGFSKPRLNFEWKFYRGNMKKFRREISEISSYKIFLLSITIALGAGMQLVKGLFVCAIVIAI